MILLAGAATWGLWYAWSAGRLRPLLANGAAAAGVALLTASPWLVRNQVTFGRPFYSTEQYDAWVLKYRPWEEIYRVYAGRLPLPHPRLLVGYGLDRVLEAIGTQFRDLWDHLSGGRIVPVAMLPLIVLGACLVSGRERRVQMVILAAATVPYWLFVLVYWHYEPRYALYLVPWAALLAAAGLGWLHDQLAAARGRGLAATAAVVALVVLLAPQVGVLRETMASDQRVPSSVVVAEWLRDNTPPDAVVMSRDPWELAFHSERRAVMIPYDDLPTIQDIARRYGVTHLHLSRLDDPARPALAPLYEGREVWGFRKVYDSRDRGGSVLVYRFPDAGR